MKLVLENKINVEIQKAEGVAEKLEIAYRYPTKKEEKEIEKLEKQLKNMIKRVLKLQKELETIDKRIEYAEKQEDFKKAEKLLDRKEKIEAEFETLDLELEKLGGKDIGEAINKMVFELLVGGKDKDKLAEIAEQIGYTKLIQKLNEERGNLEGKPL